MIDNYSQARSAEIENSIKTQEKIDGNFFRQDILSVEQFTRQDIGKVLRLAKHYKDREAAGERREAIHKLEGINIAVAFSEPSTRTYFSFMLAAQMMGAVTVGSQEMNKVSSFAKGESLEDTAKTLEAMGFDAIIMRHPQDDSAVRTANAVGIPVINGGSGTLEHPTQALLDIDTVISETQKDPAELHVAFVGDLKNGRTVHSLAKLMAIMGNRKMSFVSPEIVRLPSREIDYLQSSNVDFYETDNLMDVVGQADILYITRVQKERFATQEQYLEACKGQQINLEIMKLVKPDAVIMHPLPRVETNSEITPEVDTDPRAAYFRQVGNGRHVRMALLDLVLNPY